MLGLDNLSGYRMDIVFIFHAVCVEFQLEYRGSVVMVKLFVVKYSVCRVYVSLRQSDLLCLLQSDVGRGPFSRGVGRVVVVLINGYNVGCKAQTLDCVLGAGAHVLQKVVAGKHRARLDLDYNIFLMAVDVVYKVACCVDFCNQVPQNLVAVLADFILSSLGNLVSILVASGDGGYLSVLVVINPDFRVHA